MTALHSRRSFVGPVGDRDWGLSQSHPGPDRRAGGRDGGRRRRRRGRPAYAPRDGSVQRRSDLAGDDEDDRGFLAGVGVGAVVSAFGAGVGLAPGRRGDERSGGG